MQSAPSSAVAHLIDSLMLFVHPFGLPVYVTAWQSVPFSLDVMRRYLLVTLITAAQCAAASPQLYTGIVRREGTRAPVAGVTVTARVDPSWFDNLRGPATEVTIASTVTRADGRFELTLAAPRKRLWLQVLGMPKMVPEVGHSTRILLQDAVLRQPRPNTVNVIEVPTTFRPRPKSFNFHDWMHDT